MHVRLYCDNYYKGTILLIITIVKRFCFFCFCSFFFLVYLGRNQFPSDEGKMLTHGSASGIPTSSLVPEKSALRSSLPNADNPQKGKGKRVQIVQPSENDNNNNRRRTSGSSSSSDDKKTRSPRVGLDEREKKKCRSHKRGKSSPTSSHRRRWKENNMEDAMEEEDSDRNTDDRSSCGSSPFGGVEVAVRVRPLLENELATGEKLCAAVFRSDNRKAQQRVTTLETISLWNESKRAQRETVGGPRTTLRLLHRVAPREIGIEHNVPASGAGNGPTSPPRRGFPPHPAGITSTRESWWSQHFMTTPTVSSSTVTSGEHTVKDFHFPMVLGPSASQEEVYHSLGIERYCNAAYEGKAAAVMCFGQTGSGKTYTISGPRANKVLESGRGVTIKGANKSQQDGGGSDSTPLRDSGGEAGSSDLGESSDGLQYRAVSYLMGKRLRAARLAGKHVRIQASYVEVYNEKVNDLLQGRNNLTMHYHQRAHLFFLEGLMMVECENESDVLLVLEEGQRHRQQAAHMLNDNSSRSHTIFTLYVEVKDREEAVRASPSHIASHLFDSDDDEEEDEDSVGRGGGHSHVHHQNKKEKGKNKHTSITLNGKLSFVDLAGAERLKETGSEGEDAKSINKSLFALGSVLEKLSQQQQQRKSTSAEEQWNKKWPAGGAFTFSTSTSENGTSSSPSFSSFIPYRSSVLTKLLMDTLSGINCSELLFIACITPAARFYEESIKTLYYAQRASDVVRTPPLAATGLSGKMSSQAVQIHQLTERVHALEKENRVFRQALRLPIRGILGEDNIRQQIHRLIQQRGAGHPPLSSDVSVKASLPPAHTAAATPGTITGGDMGVDKRGGGAPFAYCYSVGMSSLHPNDANTPLDSALAPTYSRASPPPASPLPPPPPSLYPSSRSFTSTSYTATTPGWSTSSEEPSEILDRERSRKGLSGSADGGEELPSFFPPSTHTGHAGYDSNDIKIGHNDNSESHYAMKEVIVNMDEESEDEIMASEKGMECRNNRGTISSPCGGDVKPQPPSASSSSYSPLQSCERESPEWNERGMRLNGVSSLFASLSPSSLDASPSPHIHPGSSPSLLTSNKRSQNGNTNETENAFPQVLRSSSYSCLTPSPSSLNRSGAPTLYSTLPHGKEENGIRPSDAEGIAAAPSYPSSLSPAIPNPLGTGAPGGVEGAAQAGRMEEIRRATSSSTTCSDLKNPVRSGHHGSNSSRERLLPFPGTSIQSALPPPRTSHKASPSIRTAGSACRLTAEGRMTSEQKFSNRPALPPPPSALVAKAPGGRSALDILNDLPDL